MKYKIFVDGAEGTTGLLINEKLANHNMVEIITIDPQKRKDIEERKKMIESADLSILCLPDVASKEIASFYYDNENVKIIDASTAHRTDPRFVYGLPELSKDIREAIKKSSKVCVPGCHASGFNMLCYPLVKNGILSPSYPVACTSVTGYSGGGKKLIAKYESSDCEYESPNIYGLTQNHKHLPEMQKISGLSNPPLFTPIVASYFSGMCVTIPLSVKHLDKKMTASEMADFFADYYKNEYFIEVKPYGYETQLPDGFLNESGLSGTNKAEIYVFGNDDRILLASKFDNLGKGASCAAIQNMNLMLSIDEKESLN